MNIHYERREIEGERLELAERDRLTYLGPELILRRCTVIVRLPAGRLHLLPVSFIDCAIELKQELRNFSWTCAALKRTRIKGRMVGCDFGPWPGNSVGWEHGSVEDCDFSESRLDLCRFHNCDIHTLRLPRWPCFTIIDPIGKGRELLDVMWPGGFRPVTLEGRYREVPSTVATTYYAPSEARRSGTTEAELKAAIERFDCIVY